MDTLRKQILKDWNCDCEGPSSSHTYSRSTEQWADEVIKYVEAHLQNIKEYAKNNSAYIKHNRVIDLDMGPVLKLKGLEDFINSKMKV